MCVNLVRYSCGAILHRSLRSHEARFPNPQRLRDEVCDCGRVMDVPYQTFDKCVLCGKYESASDETSMDEAEGDGFREEQSGGGVYAAKAGEGEEKRRHGGVEIPIRETESRWSVAGEELLN